MKRIIPDAPQYQRSDRSRVPSELERARAHLLDCQNDLIWCRKYGYLIEYEPTYEKHFLAALSWVWEEQNRVDLECE